ncbi:CHAT domain-containing tetratricopeptide repeat protein [Candidatus Protochlamydia amoebophila]|uniref:CHAT domain-containing protein n=1 Tax=Protochlamydia amoebophila (strain UWE25) TaxID=264201 RepID=Q6MF81_PARUW|nr:CHAT domain-containing tetratricopeptide repeat protein [Candidatus Protochlamydia amoebophila]CAF22768.1 unnamed protein product [Candidatus Protochlamydia amoebophila UWE25]
MNVGSLESITWYNFLSFQISKISLSDHIKGLIEAYKTSFTTEKNIIISAKLLIEKISQLEDISIKRECLCRLLKIEIEEVQNLIVEEATSLFDLRTFLYDIQHDQAQELIHLEEIVSEIMEVKLKSNELNFVISICSIYQGILEHLWLLPHLEFGNHCSNLLVQNKTFILSHMKQWKGGLDQLANEKKIESFIPKNLEMAVLRLFEPLPAAVAKDIEEQKSVIHKTGKMSSWILEIMMKVCSDHKDFPRAIFHAEVFLSLLIQRLSEISQKKELLTSIMKIHEQLSSWNRLLRQYSTAIDHSEKALKIAQELCNPYKECIYLKDIGFLYVRLRKNEIALSFYQKALSIAQTLQDPKSEKMLLGSLAEVYLIIDNSTEAIRCYQAALNLAEEKSEQALIYSWIGGTHARVKKYKEAKEVYEKALEILPQINNPLMAIIVHQNLAKFFKKFSRYGKAIYHAEKILELIQHPSVQVDKLQAQESKFGALTILGSIYNTFRDHARKIDYYTQALKFAEKADVYLNNLGLAYLNLGNAYCDEGNYSESIKYYNKASEIIGDDSNRAELLINVGQFLFSLGWFAEAIELYEEANMIGNQDTKKTSFGNLGLCYNLLGNTKKAIECIEECVCLSQQSEDRLNEAMGYHNLGEVYSKYDLGLAEENYRKSISIYAVLHQELKNHQQWQITFFEEQAKTLLSLESLLLKQSKIEESLQITDFRRSRALVCALTKKFQFQKNDSLSSGLTSQDMQTLAHKLNTCFILYSFSVENTDSITVWVVPPQGEIICQQLPLGILKEEVEEAPYIFKTFSPIFVPTVAKRRDFIPPKKTRSLTTHSLLENLTRGKSGDQSNSPDLQTFKERLALCYETLIAPLEVYLPKDPQQVVTIIPDGFLSQIPFAAFLDKEGKYFIEKHPISIVPSIGILKLLDEIPKEFSENSLVIGNPTTPYPKDTLPLAEKEAQTIVSPLLKTFPEKILLREKATVQSVLEGMRDARWIHLACHGLTGTKPEEKLDPHSVFEGLFKLVPDESHSRGYLYAQEIASLTLRTELVFMSTCFSGRGKLHREGSVGPVWSFLAAGALSTVAAYWELRDSDLTLQMVDTFYRHLLGIEVEKLNKAQALQKAMLTAIEQKRDKPHLWGAFFLSGLHE